VNLFVFQPKLPLMRLKIHRYTLGLALGLVGSFACPTTSFAAAYELRIYSDDTPKNEDVEIELLMSVAKPKPKPSDYGPKERIVQTLIEYGYGLGHGWAVGLELPTSHVEGQHKLEGLKAEVQYVAEHNATHGGYWGVRGDIGYTSTPYDTQGGNSVGINPILGYRWLTWHAVVNPSFEIPLSGPNSKTQFQPSAKVSNAVTGTGRMGLEYFSNWGPMSSVLSRRQRDETLYVVWDEQLATSRLNLGLGKPLNPSGGSVDRWVVKVGVNFDLE
jgi:hypothetical protein